MTKHESAAVNVARFIFVVGVVIYHLPVVNFSPYEGMDNIGTTPCYDILSSRFFMTDIPLQCLFFLSGYLFFMTVRGGYSYDLYVGKINKRIKSLFVPYVFWNIFWLAYDIIKEAKMPGYPSGVLSANNIFDILGFFWERGFGDSPDFPVAGYTWFIRDLFCFAILTPMYNYIYERKKLSNIILLFLLVLSAFKNWNQPGINTWLYLGGWIAYNGFSLESFVKKSNWGITILAFAIVNWLYYRMFHYDCIRILLILVCGLTVLKLAYTVANVSWVSKIASSSMYLYVTHVLFINISRHFVVKFMHIQSDMDLCMYFVAYSFVAIALCFLSYYTLKAIKAYKLLNIMTGGRG